MKIASFVMAVSLIVLSAGCGGKEKASPAPAGGGEKASGSGSGSRAPNPDVFEDKFRIGKSAAADGVVGNETNKFTAGDPIYVSFVVRNAPSDASAKVVWKRLDGDKTMAEEQKKLSSEGFVSFAAKDTGSWPAGSYRLLKMVSPAAPGAAWRTIGTMDFSISAR